MTSVATCSHSVKCHRRVDRASQQLDIKEIKISLITIEERFDTLEQHMDGRFEALEKKFDQLLTTLTTKPEE